MVEIQPPTPPDPPPPRANGYSDIWTVRLIIGALAGTVLIALGGIIGLAIDGREPPVALSNLAAAAVGALASMLASTRRG